MFFSNVKPEKGSVSVNLDVVFSLEILISTLNFVFRKLHYQINIHRASNGPGMSLPHILKYVNKTAVKCRVTVGKQEESRNWQSVLYIHPNLEGERAMRGTLRAS